MYTYSAFKQFCKLKIELKIIFVRTLKKKLCIDEYESVVINLLMAYRITLIYNYC